MAQAATVLTIPLATGGPITDNVLERVCCAGMAAQHNDDLTDADAALILLVLPQLARELLHRRRAMGVIADMTDLDNVTFLDAARDNG
ncbi:MAG: hypothetical protein ACJAVZ_000062 [Afipia broomeae]|jgi:hypothetical protein|tara:strand:- start:210 stop:473 length:264 start_codon:yes stop_codon:yes gene_type:complete